MIDLEKTITIAFRSMMPNRPYHVQWFVTRKCNFRCKGCNVWQEQDAKELSTEDIKKGLDILKEMNVIEIVISGGNPLLREDIKEIIDYSSRSFITTVYDNGSIAAEKIDSLRNADFVAISIDSLDPAKNDLIKGVKGSWKKAIQSVEKLHEEGIKVSVTPTISQFNLYEIIELTNHFLRKNIPLWYSLYSYDSPEDSNQLFKIGKKNDMFLINDKKSMVSLCNSLIGMQRKNSNILMTTKTLEAVRDLYLEGRRTWKCQALQHFFIIDHLGHIAGCHLHEPVASIFDLPRAWNSKEFGNFRKIYSKCTKCTYLCYIFYSLHGNLIGNFQLAQERWKNAKMLLKKNSFFTPLCSSER
jgi:MoaA/NifB/PqqE/SkfB family radical SAM enzyme